MKIALASSASVGIPVLTSLLSSHHEVLYTISNPDKAYGRGQNKLPNDFAKYAGQIGLPVHSPVNSQELLVLLRADPVELVLTVAYGQLIKDEALVAPHYGWLNIHFSQLPKFRGAAPVQYAIMTQQTQTGVTVFQLDAGMDTGPIYQTWSSAIAASDTTQTLLRKLSEESALRIVEILDSIKNGAKPTAQSEIGVSTAPKIPKFMGKLSIHDDRMDLSSKVRALGENPGTFLSFRGERLGINEVEVSYANDAGAKPGELIANKAELFLKVTDGLIRLVKVVPQGKKMMSGADFARGARIAPGECCE